MSKINSNTLKLLNGSTPVSNMGNFYGPLKVSKTNEGFYWMQEDSNGTCVEEIPEYLYEALKKFQKTSDATWSLSGLNG